MSDMFSYLSFHGLLGYSTKFQDCLKETLAIKSESLSCLGTSLLKTIVEVLHQLRDVLINRDAPEFLVIVISDAVCTDIVDSVH